MTNEIPAFSPQLYAYFQSISLREHIVLRDLRHENMTYPGGKMQITPEQGQFMALLVQLMGAKKVLEIGVFTGYSSLALALALPKEGKIIACDLDPKATAIAQKYWQKASVAHKIQLHLAPAQETLAKLINQGETATFDFIFIDADKRNYGQYYEQALQLVRPGGLIAIDNVLWQGKVADETIQDQVTLALRTFNQKIHQDERVFLSVVPIGDGLTLAYKKPLF